MIQIKKTILTLVALFAMTAGAWADETLLTTITGAGSNTNPATSANVSYSTEGVATLTFSEPTLDGQVAYYVSPAWGWWGYAITLTVTPAEGYTITKCVFYDNDNHTATDSEAPFVVETVFDDKTPKVNGTILAYNSKGITKIEVYGTAPSASSATAVDIDWDAATPNIATIAKMPAGNVTVSVEYYDLATVADGGVTAADADARATTDDPLVKVDATKLTGAKKLMYFVSNSGTTAPAYDAEGWTDQLPTAKGFTQQGIVYVWYYPVGIDEGVDGATATYSDGDICLQSITARIAAEPTYAVTFAEGTDPNEWTADPNAGVTKGTPVTVTYTGAKKVIGVKAEKKAKALTITVAKGSTDLSGDKLLYYTPGETYRQAIANHPENKLDGDLGWNIWDGGNDATIFYKESTDKSRDLSIDGDQHFHPTDSINLDTVIDPTLNFYFVDPF